MVSVDITWLLVRDFPQWVFGFIGGVQALGIIVSFLISYLGWKAYKISKDNKHKYFSYGFLFLGLGFLANIVLNVLLRLGYARFIVEKRYELFVAPLFLVYYFFLIGALLAYASLAMAYANIKRKDVIWLFYVWTFIVGVYTFRQDILFNMFSGILLSFITVFTYEKYQENKNKNTLKIFLAFFSLFLFHVLIVPEQTFKIFFVIRHIILLLGLGFLLDTLLRIHYGRTTK